MQKIFHSYLKNYIFLRNEKLQDESINLIKEHEIVKNSNIYFVTKIKKIRFSKNTSINFNGNLKGSLSVGKDKIPFNYPLIEFYFSMPGIENHFKNRFNFLNTYYKCKLGINILNKLCMKYKFYKDFKINYNLSNTDGKNIYINAGLTKKLTNEIDELIIHGENFFGLLESSNAIGNLDFNGELIYIGKSKEITTRTSKHDKFSKFYSQLNDDEELLFYFLEFDDSNLSIDNYPTLNNFKVISNFEVDEITKENRINLIEASLINYFKPILNKQEKDTDLEKSNKVNEYLKKNNFTNIHIELITEGTISKFGNKIIRHNNTHNIKYNLE